MDMQNIALNEALEPPSAPPMYESQVAILRYAIPAARNLGLQIIWLNWGLTEDDLASMPPAEVRLFAFDFNTEKVNYGFGDRHGHPPNAGHRSCEPVSRGYLCQARSMCS